MDQDGLRHVGFAPETEGYTWPLMKRKERKMKSTYKMMLMTIPMLFGASAPSALASTGPFTCVASNDQSFNFQLDSDPVDYESAVYSGSANDLHGMNVAIRSLPVKVLVSPIHTRT